jgi:hypothetical protein
MTLRFPQKSFVDIFGNNVCSNFILTFKGPDRVPGKVVLESV